MTEEMNLVMKFRIQVYMKKFLRVAQMRALETAKFHHVLAEFLNVRIVTHILLEFISYARQHTWISGMEK